MELPPIAAIAAHRCEELFWQAYSIALLGSASGFTRNIDCSPHVVSTGCCRDFTSGLTENYSLGAR